MTKVFDAGGCVLGRLASQLAQEILHDDEPVKVVNAEQAIVTGEKNNVLETYRNKYHRGTERKGPHFPRAPHRLVKRTVRGMIPYDQARGRNAYERLKCYIGVPEDVDESEIQSLDDAQPKSVREHVTVAEISRDLGAKV
jgi:large subunit ribosomal protein L13